MASLWYFAGSSPKPFGRLLDHGFEIVLRKHGDPDELGVELEGFRQRGLDRRGDLRGRAVRIEEDVPAGDVGRDVRETGVFEDGSQRCHRDLVLPADVDAPQQDQVRRHPAAQAT